MSILKKFVKWFLYITIAILIVTSIIFTIDGTECLPKATLWQILLSGFLTTLVTLIFSLEEKSSIFRHILHYAVLSAVMIVCGNWFGWLNLSVAGIGMMLISVAVVYLIAFGVYYIVDMRQAEKINQKLKEKYGDEE